MTPICVSGQAKPKPFVSVSGGSALRPAATLWSCVATIVGGVTVGWQSGVKAWETLVLDENWKKLASRAREASERKSMIHP
jgi:hypothetical protein